MRTISSVLLGKTISSLTKKLNIGGGSAAPGLYALKVDPNLVEKLTSKIPLNIIITGTNGKTTTSRLISHFAKHCGKKVIRNHTGSNLERGIASALIQNYGKKFDIGIWEVDEAAFNTVAKKIKPDVVVFLNIFRDQLDRYGEIDTIVDKWCKTLSSLDKNTKVLVNGDDASLKKLTNCFKAQVKLFGVKDYKISGEAISYQKESESLDFEATNVKLNGLIGSSFDLKISNFKLKITLPLPGVYHIYDALAAFASASLLNLSISQLPACLKNFSPAFGRVEKLDLPRLDSTGKAGFGYIFLIKNPAGATQVFQTIAPQLKSGDTLLLALNDNLADGTDVSWIWDAKWERLQVTGYSGQLICSGTRAYDLALRLKYAGFATKNIVIVPELDLALQEARKGLKGSLFVLPTYTAMMELQTILVKQGLKDNYWKEKD